MSIVILCGHDRMHCRYKEICKKYGCKCKVFTQFPGNFKNQIGNPDLIVLFTNTVAHKMVHVAQAQAEKSGTHIERCIRQAPVLLTSCFKIILLRRHNRKFSHYIGYR